jgi:membrane protein implicated in regulation of membrane protease activity
MEAYVFWFVLAAIFLGVEVATGTFYFLVLSLAAVIGGILAMAGLGIALQYAIPAVLAVAGTMLVRQKHKSQKAMPDIGLDIGQPVKVLAWNADGSARVHYRGAEWDAEPDSPDMPRDGVHYIKALQGNKLIITQHKPQ